MKRISFVLLLAALFCAGVPAFAQAPPPPTLVTALASFYYVPDIHLGWRSDNNSISSTSYRVYRSDGDSVHFLLIGTTYYPVYQDFQLLSGTTYYYYITAITKQDTTTYESDRSAMVAATAGGPGGGGGGGGKRHNTGTIAGRVLDYNTQRPIVAAQVTFFRYSSAGLPVQKVLTDGSGHFKAALDTGWYLVKAVSPLGSVSAAYEAQWYNGALTPDRAEPVHVVDTSRIVVDFMLDPVGAGAPMVAVRGTVRDSGGSPLSGATIALMRSVQDMEGSFNSGNDEPGTGSESVDLGDVGHGQGVLWKGRTDSLGRYEARVAAGNAFVVLALESGFAPQFFNHQAGPLTADILQPGQDTSGMDFGLLALANAAGYTVEGLVRDSSGTQVPSRIVLVPLHHQSAPLPVRFTYTDSVGQFRLEHVQPGRYFALALPFSRYAPAYFKAGASGVRRWQSADTLNISRDLSGIDVGVVRAPAIGLTYLTGVTRSAGTPVPGVDIYAVTDDGAIAGYGLSDNRGAYSIAGLPFGHVTLASDLEGYQTAQTSITVTPGSLAIAGVDLTLAAAVTSVEASPAAPQGYDLLPNYPNPFNPSTTIAFSLPVTSMVTLRIYTVTGQEVATLASGLTGAGIHQVVWNGKDNAGIPAASGVFFYKLTVGNVGGGKVFSSVRRLLLLK